MDFAKVYTGSFESGKDSVRLLMLGGSGNVTKNMFIYEYRYDGKLRDIIIVDCGIGFPDPEMFGVDLVIPDVNYLLDKKQFIRGIFFTHGHDDHIGGIPYILPKIGPVDLFATKLTAAFIGIKLKDRGIRAKVKTVEYHQKIIAGAFQIKPIHITHSVPDASNLVISTPVGYIYHGSDYKFDFSPLDQKLPDLPAINETGRNGVLLFLTDCLGSERPGFTESEQVIGETIEKELRMCPGKLIFTTQSSNISRIQRAIDVAVANGRKVAIFW